MILLTGGTGFIGQEVVQQLRALSVPFRVLMRPSTIAQLHNEYGNEEMKTLGFEIAEGDILAPDSLPAALVGVETIIHLVGIITEDKATYEQIHIEGTRHLLTAAQQAGVTRFIHMSALGTRPQANSRYHQTKWEAEELVRQSGLAWTIFRPSLIYGYDPRDRIFKTLLRLMNPPLNFFFLRSFGLINGGKNKIQPVSLTEVSYCVAQATQLPATVGQTYDLVGPKALTFRQFIVQLAEADRIVLIEKDPWLNLICRGVLWALVIFGVLFIRLTPAVPSWAVNTPWYQAVMNDATYGRFLAGGTWLFIIVIWTSLAITALRWSSVILFPLPLFLARWGARLLGFAEPFKLALEDNIGNPLPASQAFQYQPQTLEDGIDIYLGRGPTSSLAQK